MALLEQYIDVGPGTVVIVPQAHEFVVDDDDVDQNSRHNQEGQ